MLGINVELLKEEGKNDLIEIAVAKKPEFIKVADSFPLTEEKIKRIPVAEFEAQIATEREIPKFTWTESVLVPKALASMLQDTSDVDPEDKKALNDYLKGNNDYFVVVNHPSLNRMTCAAVDIPENTIVGVYAGHVEKVIARKVSAYTNKDSYDFVLTRLDNGAITASALKYGNYTSLAPHLPHQGDDELGQYYGGKEMEHKIAPANLAFKKINFNGYKIAFLITQRAIKKFELTGPSYAFNYFKSQRVHLTIGPALLTPAGEIIDWVVDIRFHYQNVGVSNVPVLISYTQKYLNDYIEQHNGNPNVRMQFVTTLSMGDKNYQVVNQMMPDELQKKLTECQKIIETQQPPHPSDTYLIPMYFKNIATNKRIHEVISKTLLKSIIAEKMPEVKVTENMLRIIKSKLIDGEITAISKGMFTALDKLHYYLLEPLIHQLINADKDSPFWLGEVIKPDKLISQFDCRKWHNNPSQVHIGITYQVIAKNIRSEQLNKIGVGAAYDKINDECFYKIKEPMLFFDWHIKQQPNFADQLITISGLRKEPSSYNFFIHVLSFLLNEIDIAVLRQLTDVKEGREQAILLLSSATLNSLQYFTTEIEKYFGDAINITAETSKFLIEIPAIEEAPSVEATIEKTMHAIFIKAVNMHKIKVLLIKYLNSFIGEHLETQARQLQLQLQKEDSTIDEQDESEEESSQSADGQEESKVEQEVTALEEERQKPKSESLSLMQSLQANSIFAASTARGKSNEKSRLISSLPEHSPTRNRRPCCTIL